MGDIDAKSIVDNVRTAYNTGKCKSLSARLENLQNLYRMIEEHEQDFKDALKKDLNKPNAEATLIETMFAKNEIIGAMNNLSEWMKPKKPPTETYGYEIMLAKNEIVTYINNLAEWMKPKHVKKPLIMMGNDAYIRYEPLGVVLIIGAWNYPVQLTIHPLIGAIAAGNCAVIKPSELAEATAKLLEELFPKYMDKDCFRIVNGAVKETTALLEQKFDHILYTGNAVVGKIVMAAAAKHLTPVTLELGGKSPVYVDKNCDVNVAARRITWGRFVNSGQTCIAPDYIMCEKEVRDKLVQGIRETIKEFYGEDPQKSNDYGRIINTRHFKRLAALLDGVNVAVGGKTDQDDKYIEPTVLIDVKGDEPCMQHEIFGPILPIMIVEDVDEAIKFINSKDKPLALYAFSDDKLIQERFNLDTSSGALCTNDVMMHVSVDTLPFGGVGASGMGAYHGKHSFDTFSHKRACVVASTALEKANSMRYPPYSAKKDGWVDYLMAKKPNKGGIRGYWPFTLLAMVFAAVVATKRFSRGSGGRPWFRSSL